VSAPGREHLCAHGFACGANLRIPKKWLECGGTTDRGPWILLNLNTPRCGSLGLYVAAYRTPVARTQRLALGDEFAVTPDNLGLLHAAESSTMSFEAFAAQTKARNPLPATLTFGGTYTFHTADRHTIQFRLQPTRSPYRARIIGYDGRPLEADVTRWPLVDGPFLRATGRNGYVEIRHPGCAVPLILDFRTTLIPTRTDNSGACDRPGANSAQR
jgi:hypothetical protein